MQLGAILLERKLISEKQLHESLLTQRKSGGRLGDILVGEGIIGYWALYKAIAAHYQLTFVDLLSEPPDANLLDGFTPEECLKYKAVPWRKRGGAYYVATAEYSPDTIAWAKKHFGDEARLVFTSPFDIRRTVERFFSQSMESDSRLMLWRKEPELSARDTLLSGQKKILSLLLLASLTLLVLNPSDMAFLFLAACNVIYGATMLFKWLIFTEGSSVSPYTHDWKQEFFALDESTLPIYTILVPMYKEAETLPHLLAAMRALDYPASKLDIKLVLESDDRETLAAAMALKPSNHFEIIRVPSSEPRTKPKACNYALRFARGELVTVFDADDRPEPKQLKKAVIAFRTLPPDVACLQARLSCYNANDSWLSRFFQLEYLILFSFMLRGLQSLSIPIPLGGTSNHISLERLKQVGEWDPYNVTEDADLGARLASQGWRTMMLDSYTLEESVTRPVAWIRQRSRWIKGYMQTWLVHMRHPVKLLHALGWRGFMGFQFFVGLSCLTFLTAPVVWVLSIMWMNGLLHVHYNTLPVWLGWLTGINLALNFFTHWYFAVGCLMRYPQNSFRMVLAGVLYPFYMVMHSIASYKAMWQLFVKPHFWEKTMHGIVPQVAPLAPQMEVRRA